MTKVCTGFLGTGLNLGRGAAFSHDASGGLAELVVYNGQHIIQPKPSKSFFFLWETQYQPVTEARGRHYKGPENCRILLSTKGYKIATQTCQSRCCKFEPVQLSPSSVCYFYSALGHPRGGLLMRRSKVLPDFSPLERLDLFHFSKSH